jgi:chromosome segregation ATPase
MTENQEKELFNTLATLVTGVRTVQTDVQGIKVTLNEHSQTLNEHSRILNRLDAKTDSVAEKVMTNDKRLTAVEEDVSNLRGGIH